MRAIWKLKTPKPDSIMRPVNIPTEVPAIIPETAKVLSVFEPLSMTTMMSSVKTIMKDTVPLVARELNIMPKIKETSTKRFDIAAKIVRSIFFEE